MGELRAATAGGRRRRPAISAAVEKCKDQRKPAAFFGHRKVDRRQKRREATLSAQLTDEGERQTPHPVRTERFACMFRRGAGTAEGRVHRAKHQGIDQCLHWSMKLPRAVSITHSNLSTGKIRQPPRWGGCLILAEMERFELSRSFDPYTISNRDGCST